MKIKHVLITVLLLFIISSCPQPGNSSDTETVSDTDTEVVYDVLSASELIADEGPFLDIINHKIFNTTADLEYSLDNGSSWDSCTGITQDVTLSLGSHVLLRDRDDMSIQRDLGTVIETSGRPDLIPTKNLFTGTLESNSWNDINAFLPGEALNILFYLENIGDSVNSYSHREEFYISKDRVMSSDDTLLLSQEFTNSISGNSASQMSTDSITLPDLTPGIYYIGAKIDTVNYNLELNEENNVTLPEDMTEVIILSDESCAEGAVKIMNSWGTGASSTGWQHKGDDGHYWMPYEVLKNNRMVMYFYLDDLNAIYEPKLVALFQITHENRENVKIKFGLGDPSDPYMEKSFESYWGPDGGDHPFPANRLALDLTEFGAAINTYDLYIEIENSDSAAGTLENFSLEFYNDYPSGNPFKTMELSSSGSIDASTISRFSLNTADSLTSEEISDVTSTTTFSSEELNLTLEQISDVELESYMLSTGVYEEDKNYNQIYEGSFGTGYVPPTEEELKSLNKLKLNESTVSRASFNDYAIPSEVDNSASKYFPPVGNQGQKGSCSLFSVAYYIQTYTEAKKHNWDLSSTEWGTDASGYSASGAPDNNLGKIFSPDFIFHQINSGSIDGGSSIWKAIEMVLRQGGATWSTMPYRSNTDMYSMEEGEYSAWGSEDAWREAPNYRGMKFGKRYGDYYYGDDFFPYHYGYIVIEDDSDIQLLKALLSMGYCISTSIHTDYVYYNNMSDSDVVNSNARWYGLTDTDGNTIYPNHAQTIVGFKEGDEWDPANPDD